MTIRKHDMEEPHPLAGVVLEIFKKHPCLDVPALFPHLAGCTWFSGRRAAAGNKAYRIVCEDVLEVMLKQGILYRDDGGWYRVVGGR